MVEIAMPRNKAVHFWVSSTKEEKGRQGVDFYALMKSWFDVF